MHLRCAAPRILCVCWQGRSLPGSRGWARLKQEWMQRLPQRVLGRQRRRLQTRQRRHLGRQTPAQQARRGATGQARSAPPAQPKQARPCTAQRRNRVPRKRLRTPHSPTEALLPRTATQGGTAPPTPAPAAGYITSCMSTHHCIHQSYALAWCLWHYGVTQSSGHHQWTCGGVLFMVLRRRAELKCMGCQAGRRRGWQRRQEGREGAGSGGRPRVGAGAPAGAAAGAAGEAARGGGQPTSLSPNPNLLPGMACS